MIEPLSNREVEVMRLSAWGASVDDIATDLRISRETAATYLKRARSKLCALTTAHAVVIAIRHGFVTLDDVLHCDDYTPPRSRKLDC